MIVSNSMDMYFVSITGRFGCVVAVITVLGYTIIMVFDGLWMGTLLYLAI